MFRCLFLIFILLGFGFVSIAQTPDSSKIGKDYLDSLYILEMEKPSAEKPKILHAEPLYIDLIRDLGARKGEREWNVGMGVTDNGIYDEYEALVEYEWAVIDRLGLEVELPFTIYGRNQNDIPKDSLPKSRVNSLKLAAQYTFLVSEKYKTSLAIGYIHEFEAIPFANYGRENLFYGNVFNPFLIAAKRWGQNFHTLIYTGPQVFQDNDPNIPTYTRWEINSNLHYMIDGTRNFIGIEFNKEVINSKFDMTIRPQMRVVISDNLMLGIVTGIPINRTNERFSSFLRIIYEPGHRAGMNKPH